ncbi:acetyltransferase (GNAT) family protein [Kribbella voronezhensis]|uniref:Acetyltransferase (GNAT) family protein n=1 Tax=Kribbella voronezhensis TaxID=2512212 RepID=A0A4R7T8V5_9ACTN|nr:GNAT family N-acetyltransferase [Kribbella voronezhensis]TDU87776.1 acetyltransferase (GNAT) family protein [Kribbella voronezhensis]
MQIRPAVAADAHEVARLRRETFSYKVLSAAAARHMITVQSPGERFLALVAESDGRLVGWGSAGLNVWTSEEGKGSISIYVHPDHRQAGTGRALSDRLHEHLQEIGAVRVSTSATPDGLEFARRRGYDGSRQVHFAGVDPRVLPEQPATPDGIELVTIDRLEPRQVYLADSISSLDEPGDSPLDAVSYEEWLEEIWNSPGANHELGVAAVAGDEVAAFTILERDGDRAWSGMTGTIPAYRGRGLAKVIKSAALRRAAAAGITGAFTSNDDENGPMLAINNWLGYRRIATEHGLQKKL